MKPFLRPMTKDDVVSGQKFYLLGDGDIISKGVIEDVLKPSDDYKAFTADDGCRYGLENSFVKIKK